MARPLCGRRKSISWSRLAGTHNGRNKTITLSGEDREDPGKKGSLSSQSPGRWHFEGWWLRPAKILLFNHARSITRSGDLGRHSERQSLRSIFSYYPVGSGRSITRSNQNFALPRAFELTAPNEKVDLPSRKLCRS